MSHQMRAIVVVLLVLCVVVGCMTAPVIVEGRIVKRDVLIERDVSGFPEFDGQAGYVFIRQRPYIIIRQGDMEQRVWVTFEEYDLLRVGDYVDCRKKFE